MTLRLIKRGSVGKPLVKFDIAAIFFFFFLLGNSFLLFFVFNTNKQTPVRLHRRELQQSVRDVVALAVPQVEN